MNNSSAIAMAIADAIAEVQAEYAREEGTSEPLPEPSQYFVSFSRAAADLSSEFVDSFGADQVARYVAENAVLAGWDGAEWAESVLADLEGEYALKRAIDQADKDVCKAARKFIYNTKLYFTKLYFGGSSDDIDEYEKDFVVLAHIAANAAWELFYTRALNYVRKHAPDWADWAASEALGVHVSGMLTEPPSRIVCPADLVSIANVAVAYADRYEDTIREYAADGELGRFLDVCPYVEDLKWGLRAHFLDDAAWARAYAENIFLALVNKIAELP